MKGFSVTALYTCKSTTKECTVVTVRIKSIEPQFDDAGAGRPQGSI